MNTFRIARRLVFCAALALGLGGCFSIGFSGSGRLPGRIGGVNTSLLSKSISVAGMIQGSNVFRYTMLWRQRGILIGIDPINYVATSVSESLADGEAPEQFSPEQQYYVGRGVSAALISEYGMADVNHPAVRVQLRYLNQMAGYINVAAPDGAGLWKGIHVGILESKRIGAYATPGGFVWVTRGALDLVQTEDELAALICHELGHVAHEHAIQAYVKDGGGRVKPNPWLKNLDRVSPLARFSGNYFGSLAENIAKNKYGKDQEFQADKWAAVNLQLAGYDSLAMVRLLKRVDAYELKNPDRGAYLANHPPVEERIKELEELFDDDKELFQVKVNAEAGARRQARFSLVFGR